MENNKKKVKYYFPYKLFDIESRSKSQISIFKRQNLPPNTSPFNRNDKIGVYNYSKKLKSTILSNKLFSQYMNNYIGQTQDYCFKSPYNTFYPIKKNYHLLPLNERRSYISDDNITNNEINKDSVIEKPYGYKYRKTRIIIKNTKDLHRSASQKFKAKLFLNFSEGDHYHKILLKTFGLKNVDINNCKTIIKDNFKFLQDCINNLNSLENFESEKEIEFKIRNNYKNEDVIFNMKIYSICLNFYEVIEGKEKNINKLINKKKLYFPFKLLPLFYLLDFLEFKNFLSEIIYYDIKNDSMNIEQYDLKETLKKYLQYIKNIFAKNDTKYYDNISFYKNEFIFQRNYDWIICDEEEGVKKPKYKMRISFPKIIFEKKSDKIKIIHRFNKNVLIQVLKKNFIDWDKLVLFDLFSNKKFRYIINNILIGGNKYEKCTIKLFENILNNFITDENIFSNNYEFFITEATKKESYYYIFNPNIILILSGDKNKIFQKIELSLKDSKKLYEISKYWGIINTLFRCMYKDEETNKLYFKINILNNLPKVLYRKIQHNINFRDASFSKDTNNSNNIENFLEFKTKDIELLITECLLKVINITKNDRIIFYYKIPREIFKTILSNQDNIKIMDSIQKNFYEIINNEDEINILKEEEKMIEKTKGIDAEFECAKLSKKPTFRALKSNPLKTFNRMRTMSTKIKNDNTILSQDRIKSFNKKNSLLEKNKNIEKDSDKRKKVRFLQSKNSIGVINKKINRVKILDYDDKFQDFSKKTIDEDNKENSVKINNIEKFKKYKFTKKYTIDFRKKISEND